MCSNTSVTYLIILFHSTAVTVTLDMEEYTVSEDESFLDVTVSINGTLERSVEVVIESSPNTASSGFILPLEEMLWLYLDLTVHHFRS